MLHALIFSLRGLQLSFEPACSCFCCATCLLGLQLSEPISATLEADRQAGEAFPSGRLSGVQQVLTHTHTHKTTRTQPMGKTRLGPLSERPLQNQLAFKLMKRVMKRVLSFLQTADRQAGSWLWICVRETGWKEHQRYSNKHFGQDFFFPFEGKSVKLKPERL